MARRYRARQMITALGFLAPFAVFFILFLIVPIVQVVLQTFQTGGLSRRMSFAGLSNWENVFNDPVVYRSLENSLRYAAIVIPLVLVLGFIVAMLLQRIGRGAAISRAMLYFPTLAPVVVAEPHLAVRRPP